MGRMVRMDIYLVADVLDQSVSIWSSSVMWQQRLYSSCNFTTPFNTHIHEAYGSVHVRTSLALIDP